MGVEALWTVQLESSLTGLRRRTAESSSLRLGGSSAEIAISTMSDVSTWMVA
jgi:hypothetical protein